MQLQSLPDRLLTQIHRKDDDAAYQRVQKWTKKINIFEKKYIFVPINEQYVFYTQKLCLQRKDSMVSLVFIGI